MVCAPAISKPRSSEGIRSTATTETFNQNLVFAEKHSCRNEKEYAVKLKTPCSDMQFGTK